MRFLPLSFLVLALSATLLSAQTASTPQSTISFSSGDPVPGATSTNASFVSFGNPAFNALNGVAFQATVEEVDLVTNRFPISSSLKISTNLLTNTWSGIWADDVSGKRNLIARTGLGYGFVSFFTSFSDPVYNNSNAVAFIGMLTEEFATPFVLGLNGQFHPTPTTSIITGIWTSQLFANTNATSNNVFPVISFYGSNTPITNWWTNTIIPKLLPQYPSNLTLVTSLGSQAPGYSNKATFSSFDQIALPDQGGVVLLATVTTLTTNSPAKQSNKTPSPMPVVKTSFQQGIWAQDTAGTLQLIAHQGDTLNVRGTNKTIASLSFLNSTNPLAGQTRSFNQDTGNLFYTAKFTDGTQAGVKVIFP